MSGPGADRHPDKVADYNLSTIILINSVGDRVGLPMGTITELNVFEDIYSNAVTGTAHIVDAHNIIANAAYKVMKDLHLHYLHQVYQPIG